MDVENSDKDVMDLEEEENDCNDSLERPGKRKIRYKQCVVPKKKKKKRFVPRKMKKPEDHYTCIICSVKFVYVKKRKSYGRRGLLSKIKTPGSDVSYHQVIIGVWPSMVLTPEMLETRFLCRTCGGALSRINTAKSMTATAKAELEARGKTGTWAKILQKRKRMEVTCIGVGTQTLKWQPSEDIQQGEKLTMKAAQFDAPGDPSVLYVGEVAKPDLGQGEILIQVKASAINRADTLQRKGRYDPPPGASTILGLEAAGIVNKLGPNCKSKWKIGNTVMALLSGGGNAEYVSVHEDHVMPAGSLSHEEAASIPEAWLTAYQLLHFVGHMKRNDTVLIHAGGSGVGTAAIQLVQLAGGHPIVTAGSEVKLLKAATLGAEAGFNYKEVDFAESVLKHTGGKGVDMILDCVGGSNWEKNAKAIAMDGQWVLFGLLGGVNVDGPLLATILRKRVTLVGTTLRARSNAYKAELIKDFTTKALPSFEAGSGVKLEPVIDKIFPLGRIGEAHQYMEDNKTVGKVVISVAGTDGHSEL